MSADSKNLTCIYAYFFHFIYLVILSHFTKLLPRTDGFFKKRSFTEKEVKHRQVTLLAQVHSDSNSLIHLSTELRNIYDEPGTPDTKVHTAAAG